MFKRHLLVLLTVVLLLCGLCACSDSPEGITAPPTTQSDPTGENQPPIDCVNGHSYDAVVTAPTCTEGGYTTYSCAVCGDVYTGDELAAVGHAEVIQPGKAASCTEPGMTEGKHCAVCQAVLVPQEVIEVIGHKEIVVPGTAPTKTETGLTDGKKCSECGTVLLEQQVIPATGLTVNANGYYEISSADDLFLAAKNPDKNYILMNNISLQGRDWTPIVILTGIFDGNGKKITNVNIVPAEKSDSNLGFFGCIAETGEVKKLDFVNVTINSSQTEATAIGVIAGEVRGKITDCSAIGVVNDTRTPSVGNKIYVGCLAGKAYSGAIVKGNTNVIARSDVESYPVNKLSADVRLFVAESDRVVYGLVGDAAAGSKVSGQWRDSFYSSQRLSETMRQRQKIVTDYMYRMCTVAWTVPVEMKTILEGKTTTFKPGVTYYGLPYSHCSGSYEMFMKAMDPNNKVADWIIKDYGTVADWNAGEFSFTEYIGNDCSSAVGWAWAQVSPGQVKNDVTGKYEGGAANVLTKNMVPNFANRAKYGIYPVGNWTGATFDIAKAAYQVTNETKTSEIILRNGVKTIYEAFAQTRKADALLTGEPGGHARLVAEDPVVIRNADGTIDGARSYFLTHEQGASSTNSSCRAYYKYTFADLCRMEGLEVKASYIPVTIRAMRDETLAEPVVMLFPNGGASKIISPSRGGVYSNYRIVTMIVTVKDANGKVYYNKEAIVDADGSYQERRGEGTVAELQHCHPDVMKDAPKGLYTFTVQVKISTGEVLTVVQDQEYRVR